MQINITGKHFTISESLQHYVEQKLKRLEHHFDYVTNVHVVLSKIEKTRMKAEATVHITGGNLFADASEETIYAAIDILADKLHRQVIRHKEKLTNHHPHRSLGST